MKLIIGGCHQGKTAYGTENYGITEWVDGESCSFEAVKEAKGLRHFHLFIKRELEAGRFVGDLAQRLIQECPELVIITDEVGYGIVPMKAEERAWREACGRVCTKLAAYAEEVIRVSCGLGQKLK